MFNVGLGELVAIFIIALIFWGPNALPEIGRTLGRATRTIRDLARKFREELGGSVHELDVLKSTVDDIRNPVAAFTREFADGTSDTGQPSRRVTNPVKTASDGEGGYNRNDPSVPEAGGSRSYRLPTDEDDYLSMLIEKEYVKKAETGYEDIDGQTGHNTANLRSEDDDVQKCAFPDEERPNDG